MKPTEFEYFQLIDGMMYPAKKQKGPLMPKTVALGENVINPNVSGKTQPHKQAKIDTVTPKFSIQDDED